MKTSFIVPIVLLLSTSAGAAEPLAESAGAADLPAELRLPPGFRMELVYRVPRETQGSWVSLALDGAGGFFAADQHGKLYRVQPAPIGRPASETTVTELPVEIGMAQGLLFHRGRLYVMVNNQKPDPTSGLYGVDDTNGDGLPDKVQLLRKLAGNGEHGQHAIVAAPDGNSLFVCCGNMTPLTEFRTSRVPRVWREDVVLPRIGNPPGMFQELKAPGGWIAKVDLTGQQWELFAVGFRNEYDLAFNHQGELFTFDSDSEYDIGTPWYRPTRICHVTSGAEFGWRYGSGVWPARFEDSVPPAVEVGPGSPTGMTFGYGAKFPQRFQDALFAADWSHGRIFWITLTPHGGTIRGEWESFASAAPLPTTDLVVNPTDGALYLTVGGRDVQSALYRIVYAGEESLERVEALPRQSDEVHLRRKLEQLHATPVAVWTSVYEQAWPQLSHSDRAVRFAARTAIEQQPVEQWRELALNEPETGRQLIALLALVRCGTDADREAVAAQLANLDWDSLQEPERLVAVRVLALCLARGGKHEAIQSALDIWGPQDSATTPALINDLAAVASGAEHPLFVSLALPILQQTTVAPDRLPLAHALATYKPSWQLEQRQTFFTVLNEMLADSRGRSMGGYVERIYELAEANVPMEQKPALAKLLAEAEKIRQSTARRYEPRPVVKQYATAEVEQIASQPLASPDPAVGRRLFHAARCAECHRLGDAIGAVGPDLTTVGKRYSLTDLVRAIVEPNATISDQYQQTEFVVDGETLVGRITDLLKNQVKVATDITDPKSQRVLERDDIESQRPSKVSPMPSGLLDSLSETEVRELLAYLRNSR